MENYDVSTTIPLIAATQVVPYRERVDCDCPKCGIRLNRMDRFKMWLMSSAMATVNIRYCGGGKQPTEQVGVVEAMMRGKEERFNVCAGVSEPHLHLTCRSCNYEWLMQVKSAR
jgi:hypothetical protein